MSLWDCADTCKCASEDRRHGPNAASCSDLAKQTPAAATQSHMSGLSCQGGLALHVRTHAQQTPLDVTAEERKPSGLGLRCEERGVAD